MLSEQSSPTKPGHSDNGSTGADKYGAGPPPLTDADLLEMYRTMVLSRTLDQRIWQMNRQGRAAIVASAQGHEAAQVGAIRALDPERDRFYIYYRELTTMLALGVTPLELLLGFLAKEGEPLSGARQFPLHGAIDRDRRDIVSFSNVVATQLPQAVGVALADKMRGDELRLHPPSSDNFLLREQQVRDLGPDLPANEYRVNSHTCIRLRNAGHRGQRL